VNCSRLWIGLRASPQDKKPCLQYCCVISCLRNLFVSYNFVPHIRILTPKSDSYKSIDSIPKRAMIAQSVQRWATDWTIGVLGFDSRRRLGVFLFTTASRTVLEPIQLPIQWVAGALSLRVKRPGREVDQSPPSSAEVKEWVELYIDFPICLYGMVLS
jgi:hypothetical protein